MIGLVAKNLPHQYKNKYGPPQHKSMVNSQPQGLSEYYELNSGNKIYFSNNFM